MSNDMQTTLALVLVLILMIAFISIGPVFTIWSLNLLFGFNIPVNFSTWCAVVWLTTVLHGIKINTRGE